MYKNDNYLCIPTINPKNPKYKPKKIPNINPKNPNPPKDPLSHQKLQWQG